MKKNHKLICSIFLICLIISSTFSSISLFSKTVSAQETTCADIKREEFENWPSVVYCKNPIAIYNHDGDNADVETFYSPDCDLETHPISCLSESAKVESEPNYGEDNIQTMMINTSLCKIVTDDTIGYYEQKRKVGVVCSNIETNEHWSDWQTSGSAVATFYSPNCPTDKHPISCLSESAKVESEPNYGEDDIVTMKIDGSRCAITAHDTKGTYCERGSNEHKRKVGVVCSSTETNELWDSSWQTSSSDVATFYSPNCPTDKHPISCLSESATSESENNYGEDTIQSMIIDGSRCKVTADDTCGLLEHKRKIGVVCSDVGTNEHWSDWQDRTGDFIENRYYVFVNKPKNDINIELTVSGIPLPPNMENLHPGVAHWDGSRIIGDGNGSFVVHSSGSSLSLTPSDPKVRMLPVDECTPNVIVNTILNEEFKYGSAWLSVEDLSSLVGAFFPVAYSSMSPQMPMELPPTDTAIISWIQTNLPELKLKFDGNTPDAIAMLTGSKRGFLHTSSLADVNNAKNFLETFPDSLDVDIISKPGGDWVLIATRHVNPSDPNYVNMADFRQAFLDTFSTDPVVIKNADIKVGEFLGYPHNDIIFWTEGGSYVEVAFNAWQNNEPVDPNIVLAGWNWRSVNALDTKQYAQSYALQIRRVDKTYFDSLVDISRDSFVNSLKSYAENRLGRSLTPQELVSLDSWVPSKETIKANFETLHQEWLATNILQVQHNLYNSIIQKNEELLNALKDGDTTKIESIKNDLQNLKTNVDSAGLPSDVKQKLDNIIDSDITIAGDALTSDISGLQFRGDMWATYSWNINDVTEANWKIWSDVDGIGYHVYTQFYSNYNPTVYGSTLQWTDVNVAADKATYTVNGIENLLGETYYQYAGDTLRYEYEYFPEDFNKPIQKASNSASYTRIKSFTFSFIFLVAQDVAPRVMEYAQRKNNYALYYLAMGSQIAITGASLYWVTTLGHQAINLAIQGSWSGLGTLLANSAQGFLVAYILAQVINIVVSWAWCNAYPESSGCPCYTDPAYGKKMWRLEKNIVSIGENFHYIYYGNLYCRDLTQRSVFHGIQLGGSNFTFEHPEGSTLWELGETYGYTYFNDSCVTLDGKCFDCVVNVQNFTKFGISFGKYNSTITEWDNGLGANYGLVPEDGDEPVTFYACPANTNGFDESENKCVTCDTTTHTEIGGGITTTSTTTTRTTTSTTTIGSSTSTTSSSSTTTTIPTTTKWPHISISSPSNALLNQEFNVELIYTHDTSEQGGIHLRWEDSKFDIVDKAGCDAEYIDNPSFASGWEGIECSHLNTGTTKTFKLKGLENGIQKLYYRAWDHTQDYNCGSYNDYSRDPTSGTCSSTCHPDGFPDNWEVCNASTKDIYIGATSTIKIYDSEDTYVYNTNPNTNYGSDRIVVRNQSFGHVGPYVNNGWVKFDLSSLPSGIIITSAKIYMAGWSTSPGSIVQVHLSSDDSWSESTITWNNQPSYGGIISEFPGAALDSVWDVTNAVKQEYNGNKKISLVFTHIRTDQDGASFDSKEVIQQNGYGHAPYLEINIPISTTTTIISGGGGGGGGRYLRLEGLSNQSNSKDMVSFDSDGEQIDTYQTSSEKTVIENTLSFSGVGGSCEKGCGASAACDEKTRGSDCGSGKYCNSYCQCVNYVGGCPTLFVYDGKEYVKERKSNIHSQSGIDTVDDIALTTKPVVVNGYYLLQLKETTLPEHSYIDTVKLFVTDSEGKKEAELLSAKHSKYGDVTDKLTKSDDIRTDTQVFDNIELKFKVPELKGEASFMFEIEGYNPAKEIRGITGFLTRNFPVKMDIADFTIITLIVAIASIAVIFVVFKFFARKKF